MNLIPLMKKCLPVNIKFQRRLKKTAGNCQSNLQMCTQPVNFHPITAKRLKKAEMRSAKVDIPRACGRHELIAISRSF